VVTLQKEKLLNIFMTIIQNSIDALQGIPNEKRKISLKLYQDNDYIFIRIQDTGQ